MQFGSSRPSFSGPPLDHKIHTKRVSRARRVHTSHAVRLLKRERRQRVEPSVSVAVADSLSFPIPDAEEAGALTTRRRWKPLSPTNFPTAENPHAHRFPSPIPSRRRRPPESSAASSVPDVFQHPRRPLAAVDLRREGNGTSNTLIERKLQLGLMKEKSRLTFCGALCAWLRQPSSKIAYVLCNVAYSTEAYFQTSSNFLIDGTTQSNWERGRGRDGSKGSSGFNEVDNEQTWSSGIEEGRSRGRGHYGQSGNSRDDFHGAHTSAQVSGGLVDANNSLRVLVATDCHLGYMEKDEIRRVDSFQAFEEICSIAEKNQVDFLLLGGDLFHENKPSRSTLVKTIEILRRYCLNDRPVQFQVVSDQTVNFQNIFGHVNYEDPHFNVGLPVFTIHGNHDDPAGVDNLSAIDILSASNLVNYFGKMVLGGSGVGEITIYPILIRKGITSIALYGLGNIRDERLNRMFQTPHAVQWIRPEAQEGFPISDWFNILVLHQNRVKANPKNAINEHFLPRFLDFVVWGHEHECLVDPQEVPGMGFHITQPGSSVATSLIDGEAKPKHVLLLEIKGSQYRPTKIPLKSVRPFEYAEVVVLKDEDGIDPNDQASVLEHLDQVVRNLIDRSTKSSISRLELKLPLVRIKVDYSGFSTINPQRFGQKYVGKVANPQDILIFSKTAKKRQSIEEKIDESERLRPEELNQQNIEALVAESNLVVASFNKGLIFNCVCVGRWGRFSANGCGAWGLRVELFGATPDGELSRGVIVALRLAARSLRGDRGLPARPSQEASRKARLLRPCGGLVTLKIWGHGGRPSYVDVRERVTNGEKMEILAVNDLDIALHDFVNKDDKLAFYSCLRNNLEETRNKLTVEADTSKIDDDDLIVKVGMCMQACLGTCEREVTSSEGQYDNNNGLTQLSGCIQDPRRKNATIPTSANSFSDEEETRQMLSISKSSQGRGGSTRRGRGRGSGRLKQMSLDEAMKTRQSTRSASASMSVATRNIVDEGIDSSSSEETERHEMNEIVESSEPEETNKAKGRKRAAPRGRGRDSASSSKRGRKPDFSSIHNMFMNKDDDDDDEDDISNRLKRVQPRVYFSTSCSQSCKLYLQTHVLFAKLLD
ncbi:hypothetical protein ZIOFF_010947 [Zingiber officinale]|uniref:Double-strand break repair protein MRE11 n=1 Tax=Zingiber officinale TaxID=94328 RepID=A0A8J5HWM2_ZINOF|nr:hypothetical protein ZIOFF_010947 [Zingiber officinale]